MTRHRLLSMLVSGVYLVLAGKILGMVGILRIAVFLFFPMVCIWAPDSIDKFAGIATDQSKFEDRPGWIIQWGGWLLLLFPLFVYPLMQFAR